MALVSVTRLRIRSFRYLPQFIWFALASMRQVRRSPGFLIGQLASEPGLGFWTLTLWRDEASMRAYRDSGVHRRAMPRLLDWCDEASYIHWLQEGTDLPTLEEARQRMMAEGHVSKVHHPTAAHAQRQIAPAPGRLRPGVNLGPVR